VSGYQHVHSGLNTDVPILHPDGRIIGWMSCLACLEDNAAPPAVDPVELGAVVSGDPIPCVPTDEELEQWLNGEPGPLG